VSCNVTHDGHPLPPAGDSSSVTQLELDWVRERRAAYERAYPDVPSETREVSVSAAEFAAFERSEPYRGSSYVWTVRDPADAPPTSESFDEEPDDRPRVLLLLPRGETEQWGLPGGGIESGEDHEAAARREVREETGVDCELGDPWLFRHRVWSVPDEPDAATRCTSLRRDVHWRRPRSTTG